MSSDRTKTRRLSLGRLFLTQSIIDLRPQLLGEIYPILMRHAECDWGDVSSEDREANERALEDGSRILSVYHLTDGTKIWIITDAEDANCRRPQTTVMLPSDY
jgi:hypothetical protein